MKESIILLYASLLGFGMIAHAAGTDVKGTAKQEQIKKLRLQAEKSHKKADALTAQADKLESGASVKPGEKMRGGIGGKPEKHLGGGGCVSDGRISCGISGK
jgi:hypothetical protein